MSKYSIIAGGVKLPYLIYKSLIYYNKNVIIIGIKNNFANIYNFKKINEVKLGSLSKIFKILNDNNINKIIFAGSIKRPTLKDLSLDLKALEFLMN